MFDFDNLSNPIIAKNNELLEREMQLKNIKNKIEIPIAITLMVISYFLINGNRIVNYTSATFTFSRAQAGYINKADVILLIIEIISIRFIYNMYSSINRLKSENEILREDLIKDIENDFCIHDKDYSSKDEYIKDMESKGINLIFK